MFRVLSVITVTFEGIANALVFLLFLFGFSHPPPAFGSSPNLEALALEGNKQHDDEEDNDEANASSRLFR